MERYIKNRLLSWVLIFLIIVNLVALGTYFLLPRPQEATQVKDEVATPGYIYRSRLGLTGEQARQVDLISAKYQEVTRPVAEKIKGLRSAILDELAHEEPDMVRLDTLSKELSELQWQLQRENIEHYLALKEVCTPEQALRLSNLYRELYSFPKQGKGRKFKQKHGR